MSDAELVARARQGDTAAFGELVDRHRAAVYRAAHAALGSASEAEDVAQEAFLAAYRKMATYRGEASFKTWLLTIAWRRARRRRRRLASWWRRLVSGDPPESAMRLGNGRTPEGALIDAEMAQHVQRLVRALPARLRDPLLLCASGEQTYHEIASVLGIPEGTLKWRVAEARRRLKQRLAALGYGDD
ncbi:MAG TPA: RNA polymerase sigma factor [Vicinamibacteria bacterium]